MYKSKILKWCLNVIRPNLWRHKKIYKGIFCNISVWSLILWPFSETERKQTWNWSSWWLSVWWPQKLNEDVAQTATVIEWGIRSFQQPATEGEKKMAICVTTSSYIQLYIKKKIIVEHDRQEQVCLWNSYFEIRSVEIRSFKVHLTKT